MNITNPGVTRFLTKQEVAQILQVSLKTVTRCMACGLPYKKVGRSVRIPENEFIEWLKEDASVNLPR
jgi:excisionase family DNA binding protein